MYLVLGALFVLTFIEQAVQRAYIQLSKNKQSTKHKVPSSLKVQMKIVLLLIGILIATAGGVITYRALYLDPSSAVVITNTQVREVPNYARILGGTLLLVGGAAIAFFGVRRRAK